MFIVYIMLVNSASVLGDIELINFTQYKGVSWRSLKSVLPDHAISVNLEAQRVINTS